MSLVTASEADIAQILNREISILKTSWIVVFRLVVTGAVINGYKFFGMRHHRGWESRPWSNYCFNTCQLFDESGCLGLQPKMGGRSHPKLNILGRPIAKKYSGGKVKRTLKRRWKVLETVKRETDGASNYPMGMQFIHFCSTLQGFSRSTCTLLVSDEVLCEVPKLHVCQHQAGLMMGNNLWGKVGWIRLTV